MAEQVQAALDQMVEPLQDLQQRNVFTPAEIHAIVERRRDYEYMLRRRNVRKVDCLKYVDDEVKLEQLRELRTRKIQREAREALQKLPREEREKQAKQLIQKHIGDRHVLQHIHSLWTRIFRKFRADQDLYLQYAEFLKEQGANGKLSQLYASVLAIFPRESAWWIRAASHEFFTNNNAQAARVMLQRGLRVNPKSNDLWVQSFVLELHFVQKIHGRRQLLELPTSSEEDELYKLARLVHDNAIHSVDDDGATSLLMWQHCQYFPFTDELQQHILKALRVRCSDKPQAWIAMAQCSLKATDKRFSQNETNDDENDGDGSESDNGEENNEVPPPPPRKKQKLEKGKDMFVDILNEAIQSIPSSGMYVEAVRFLRSIPITKSRRQMIEKIFEKANVQNKVTVEILLEHVNFLEECGQRKAALKKFRKYTGSNKVTDARIWTRWAKLVFPNPEAATILSKALNEISMASSDHYMSTLLQFMGVNMALKRTNDCWAVWDQILLLSPGSEGLIEEATLFGVKSIADGCLQFLSYVSSLDSLSDTRKVYEAVLFQSSLLDRITESNVHLFKSFVDTAVECELKSSDEKLNKNKRIYRILDVALKKFENVPKVVDDIRQRRDDVIYGNITRSHEKTSVPCFDYKKASMDDILDVYRERHIVVLRNAAPNSPASFQWRNVGLLFQSLNAEDQESWCIEQKNSNCPNPLPSEFLLPLVTDDRAYCSFLVQKDTQRYESVLQRLPFIGLKDTEWFYEKALWIFFGRNPVGHATLTGRPEHTDSVSHDGTWHYQLFGSKEWHIRPSSPLLELWRKENSGIPFDSDSQLKIVCQEGDVILINTRLWFHRTELPAGIVPSVSYARDFRWQSPSHQDGGMTNVDGLYATEDMEAGTIVFTEKDMPDCELHRSSTNPNCEVIQLEDGTGAIASLRAIQAGEFFCIAESDDDDDEEADDDEEEEEFNECE